MAKKTLARRPPAGQGAPRRKIKLIGDRDRRDSIFDWDAVQPATSAQDSLDAS